MVWPAMVYKTLYTADMLAPGVGIVLYDPGPVAVASSVML